MPHRVLFSPSDKSIVGDVVPATSQCQANSHEGSINVASEGSPTPVLILTDIQDTAQQLGSGLDAQEWTSCFQVWHVTSNGVMYAMRSFEPPSGDHEAMSEVLTLLLSTGACATLGGRRSEAFRIPAAHLSNQRMHRAFFELMCAGFVAESSSNKEGVAGTTFEQAPAYLLTELGMQSLVLGHRLRSPSPIISIRPRVALADMTALELALRAAKLGWQWQRFPVSSAQRKAISPYQVGDKQVWYTHGATINQPYLQCLLSASRLQDEFGTTCIPHGQRAATYEAMLQGKHQQLKKTNFAFVDDAEGLQLQRDGMPSKRKHGHGPVTRRPADKGIANVLTSLAALADGEEMHETVCDDDAKSSVTDHDDDTQLLAVSHAGSTALGSHAEATLMQPPGAHGSQHADEDENKQRSASGAGNKQVEMVGHDQDDDRMLTELLEPGSGALTKMKTTQWGHFRITPKQPSKTNKFGGWQASCPYHRRNDVTGCKKYIAVPDDGAEARDAALRAVILWCSRAPSFDRQWKHMGFHPATNDAPPWPMLHISPTMFLPRPEIPETDVKLDGAAAPKAKANATQKRQRTSATNVKHAAAARVHESLPGAAAPSMAPTKPTQSSSRAQSQSKASSSKSSTTSSASSSASPPPNTFSLPPELASVLHRRHDEDFKCLSMCTVVNPCMA